MDWDVKSVTATARWCGVHHKHLVTMDRINPKDCQVLSLGDSGFLQFLRVVSSDYGKPRGGFKYVFCFPLLGEMIQFD